MAEKIEDGGSAFPSDQPRILVPNDLPKEWVEKIVQIADQTKGMTLRDYFAAAALTGILANADYLPDVVKYSDGKLEKAIKVIAKEIFEISDAMLAQRK